MLKLLRRIALKCPELSCIAFSGKGRVITMIFDFGSEKLINGMLLAQKVSI